MLEAFTMSQVPKCKFEAILVAQLVLHSDAPCLFYRKIVLRWMKRPLPIIQIDYARILAFFVPKTERNNCALHSMMGSIARENSCI